MLAPSRHANQDDHVDYGSQAYRNGAKKQRLVMMPDHEPKQPRPENVAQDGDGKEEDVEDYVENKDDVQPGPIVGEIVQEDGNDAGAHVDGEPSRIEQMISQGAFKPLFTS